MKQTKKTNKSKKSNKSSNKKNVSKVSNVKALNKMDKPKFFTEDRLRIVMFGIFSILFALFRVFSMNILYDKEEMTYLALLSDVTIKPFGFGSVIIWVILAAVIFAALWFIDKAIRKYGDKLYKDSKIKNGHVFLFAVLFSAIIWIPCLMTYYPGGLFADTYSSLKIVNGEPLNNHNPLLYTCIWILLFKIGGLLKLSGEATLFIFTFIQYFFMSLSVGYFVYVCRKKGIRIEVCALILIYYTFFNLVPLYVVSLWKDTPFSTVVFMLSTFLFDMLWDENVAEKIKEPKNIVIFFVLNLLVAFLRNNGIYIVFFEVVCLVVLLFMKSKEAFLIFGTFAFLFVLVIWVVQGSYFEKKGFNRYKEIESVGVPLQQIGYIYATGGEISDESREVFNNMISDEDMIENYRPFIVDSLKWSGRMRYEYLRDHMGEFLKAYVDTAKRNPGKAFQAYLLSTLGFWDVTRQYNNGYINNFMLMRDPYRMTDEFEEMFNVSLRDFYQPKILVSSAIFAWLAILSLCNAFIYKKRLGIVSAISVALWGTLMIATPISFSMRYVFALVLCAPIYILVILQKEAVSS